MIERYDNEGYSKGEKIKEKEKEASVFGTLVIILPCDFEGASSYLLLLLSIGPA